MAQGNEPRTIAQVRAAGGADVARLAVQGGGGYWAAYRAVAAAYPESSYVARLRIASEGYQRARTLASQTQAPSDRLIPLTLGRETLDPNARLPYRYIVTVTYPHPITGETVVARDVINQAERLTGNELVQLARQRARQGDESREIGTPDAPEELAAPDTPDDEIRVTMQFFAYRR